MRLISPCLTFVFSALLFSCGEDPELVRKHGEQEAEIAKLTGELALMEERMKYLPADQSAELAAAEQETRKLEADHKKLAEEVADLEAESEELKDQYEKYRVKYTVR
jgi:septal ring factor EnvC (AmiA/AmiB activator)